MKTKWEKLYSQMLEDIDRCRKVTLPETICVECCYRVAMNYWKELKKLYMSATTHVDAEEIKFFKEVKPLFTSHIEYYLILNQVTLFVPSDELEKMEYWNEEEKRYQRVEMPPQERIYEDADCRSSHDSIVRGLLANKMYNSYVLERIKQLSTDEV